MVAVIHQSSSLRNILNYNEQKVKDKQAVVLVSGGFIKNAAELNFPEKLRRFEKLTELNQTTRVNSLHISLNFDPSEQLPEERLREIAQVYMDKIGFGGQPYLAYQHFDAGHPHLHLVTTNIRSDGKAITLHNLAKVKSKNARLEIEKEFGLVPAQGNKQQQFYQPKPVNAAKVAYGKTDTKRAIGNVLQTVIPNYKYASLPELNAVLGLYNIIADRGDESSRVFRHQGLNYRVLDEDGNKVGVPIKASLFFSKPTLKNLEEKFKANKELKEPNKARVKNAIDLYFLKGESSLDGLVAALKPEGIDTVIRRNDEGLIYGVTYVDHRKQCVFNGSALGKPYSAKTILERCTLKAGHENKTKQAAKQKQGFPGARRGNSAGGYFSGAVFSGHADAGKDAKPFTDVLLGTDEPDERMAYELKGTRRKKKKRRVVAE